MQLELSEKQLFRIQKNVEAGREAISKQYEMESKVSEDRLSYTIAVNTLSQAQTNLKQTLQLEPGTEFDVAVPEIKTPFIEKEFKTDSIFKIASGVLPRLKAIDYEIKASKKQVASSKGAILPRLSVGGSVYSGYYKVISEGAANQGSFNDQLKNNNSQAVYMSLQVPIFNNFTTGRNIKLARIRENDNELRLELEKNNLYTEIENACLNYNKGRDEYFAASSNLEYNKKSFEVVEKKFEAGLVDVTDYSAASTTLLKARDEDLRTRLQLMIRMLTLELYTTGEYDKIKYNQ
jgi:outer membrane protein